MPPLPPPPPPYLLTISVSLLLLLSATTSSAITDKIRHLRSRSPSGVIRLTDDLLRRIISLPPPRPFSFLVFFDAKQLHQKHELQLPTLKSHFSLVSSSFLINNHNSVDSNKLFFFELEFKDSQRSFSLFDVDSLPHVRLVTPDDENLKDSDAMNRSELSRMLESMAEFIESRTGLTVGPIHEPPLLSGKQMAFIMAGLMIWSPFAVKKIISGDTLFHDKRFWLIGCIFVYFFSVSGTMHNIIRQMPLFIPDSNDPSKSIFFYRGSGLQLGVEAFVVGFLYTMVGLILGFITQELVKVKNLKVQRVIMISGLICAFWAVKKVVFLDNWKTGYDIHGYWPSSW